MYEFGYLTKVVFGIGVVKNIGNEILKFYDKLPSPLMIVTINEKWNQDLLERIKANLREDGCRKVDIFKGVKPDPTRQCVREGIEQGEL